MNYLAKSQLFLSSSLMLLKGLVIGLISNSFPAFAAPDIDCISVDKEKLRSYTVSSVVVLGHKFSKTQQNEINRISGVGGLIDFKNVIALQAYIANIFKNDIDEIKSGFVSAVSQPTHYCLDQTNLAEKRLKIVISPYYIRVATGGNAYVSEFRLQTPKVSFSSNILPNSTPLSFDSDQRYGTSAELRIDKIDLYSSNNFDISASTYVKKSLSRSYADYAAGIEFKPSESDGVKVFNYKVKLVYANKLYPLGVQDKWSEDLALVYSIRSGTIASPQAYQVGGSTSFGKSLYSTLTNQGSLNQEFTSSLFGTVSFNAISGRMEIGGIGQYSNSSLTSTYYTMRSFLRYEAELGADTNTVGITFLAGAGGSIGNVPDSNKFFAGYNSLALSSNTISAQSSLKDSFGDATLRSAGSNQLGALDRYGNEVGGTRYVNGGLSVAIPIKAWAKPLIPDMQVCLAEDIIPCPVYSTVREQLANQFNDQYGNAVGTYAVQQNISIEQAEKELKPIWEKRVWPVFNTIVNKTNLYSVRPLLLADFVQLGADQIASSFVGLGGGIQASFVNASLELGYMKTLAPERFNHVGNFFMRFRIRNFSF